MKLQKSETVVIEVSEFVIENGAYKYGCTTRNAVLDEKTIADSIRYLIEECRPASVEDQHKLEFAIGHHFNQITFRIFLSDKPYAYRRFTDSNGEAYTQDVAIEHVAMPYRYGKMVPAIICNGFAYLIQKVDVDGADIVFDCCRLGNIFPTSKAFHYGKISCSSGDKLARAGFDTPC